ncbi:MAG: hypothetical protein R3C13_07915 [Hyphomonas sp.]|uniref:hypothetical protein n=1 Tax=Hyphomonas sp. TaxID=87 RepID=UPI00352958F1
MRVRPLLVAALLAIPLPAAALTKDEFTAAIMKVWSMDEQVATLGYKAMLANEDLDEGQVKYVELALAGQRRTRGDDMTGAFDDYIAYMTHYPDAVGDEFIGDLDGFLTQFIATSERVIASEAVDEQYITDLWNLGYWFDAASAMKMAPPSRPDALLLKDMQQTGYLCSYDPTAGGVKFRFRLNDLEQPLTFCPDDHLVTIRSPQPFMGGRLRQTVLLKSGLAAEVRAGLAEDRSHEDVN